MLDFENKKYRVVTYSIDISTALSDKKLDIVLENDITKIVGVKINSQLDVQAYNRGTIGIKIDKKEVFPDDFEAKNIMAGLDCPPQKRFWELEKEVKQNQIELFYKDNSHPSIAFAVNRVNVVLLCETTI